MEESDCPVCGKPVKYDGWTFAAVWCQHCNARLEIEYEESVDGDGDEHCWFWLVKGASDDKR